MIRISSLLPPLALSILLTLAAACGGPSGPSSEQVAAYQAELGQWRQQREERLREPTGWLTLTGLFWLHEGDNRVGSDPTSEIVLPETRTPLRVGVMHLESRQVVFTAEPRVRVTHGGEPVETLALASDAEGEPTVLELGSVQFHVIDRDGRLGVRVRDLEHPALATFRGLDFYPADLAWRLSARFEPYDPPRTVPIANVVGMVMDNPVPGALRFEVDGETYRLDVLPGGDESFFLIFADQTSGHGTYGAGRYLSVPRPDAEGRVELDFNKAYNPPCAFTEFATCPLPPPQNRLRFAVEAGEKYSGDHAGA